MKLVTLKTGVNIVIATQLSDNSHKQAEIVHVRSEVNYPFNRPFPNQYSLNSKLKP